MLLPIPDSPRGPGFIWYIACVMSSDILFAERVLCGQLAKEVNVVPTILSITGDSMKMEPHVIIFSITDILCGETAYKADSPHERSIRRSIHCFFVEHLHHGVSKHVHLFKSWGSTRKLVLSGTYWIDTRCHSSMGVQAINLIFHIKLASIS